MAKEYDPFANRHKFQDDVWREIKLNDLERDVIDTPEFQRLFRTSQLGFVDLVYQTANHTRGSHSIGACYIAGKLVERLNENTSNLSEGHENGDGRFPEYAPFVISPAETILIRLGAILHDISHNPLSHDLEKKTHRIYYPKNKYVKIHSWYGHYPKHDDYEQNPVLYRLLCDTDNSVLARVLQFYSKDYWRQLEQDSKAQDSTGRPAHPQINPLVALASCSTHPDWEPATNLLPDLLFHLLLWEKPDQGDTATQPIITTFESDAVVEEWYLGPTSLTKEGQKEWHDAWYQPFRHDIIGNTLSADLLDYLARDLQHLGSKRRLDLHLLNYYVLVNPNRNSEPKRFRCAIDLHDHKRGTTRTFLLNDIFRLLDLRQEIHEKAVMHRVVQSANAMLARGLLLLKLSGKQPTLRDIIGLREDQHHALQSEDVLFDQLLQNADDHTGVDETQKERLVEARRLISKITERRVFRPLMIIPGDLAAEKLPLPKPHGRDHRSEEFPLRSLATIVDSAYYSRFLLFICHCVETYLQSVLDTDAELQKYAEKVAATERLEEAYGAVSSRVLVWTTPYKQLYKDPAVVIALEGCVGQVDEVTSPDFSQPLRDEKTWGRIDSAINDADTKYDALWRLYVFISDGLFYSGILDKLLVHLPSACTAALNRDTHRDRLEKSQKLFEAAIRTICRDWGEMDRKLKSLPDKQKQLMEQMEDKCFTSMVSRWLGEYRSAPGAGERLSTVDIANYYHEYSLDPTVETALKRPCRDTRYKYDKDASHACTKATEAPKGDEHKLIEFLKKCGLDAGSILSEAEFHQLCELYKNPGTRERCDKWLNEADGPARIPNALKALWSQESLLLEEPQTAPGVVPAVTEAGIRKWLLQESEALRPHVRRELTEDLQPVIAVIQWAAPGREQEVIDDLRRRFRNEATLVWNHIRPKGVADALKRRWKYPEPPGSDDEEENTA